MRPFFPTKDKNGHYPSEGPLLDENGNPFGFNVDYGIIVSPSEKKILIELGVLNSSGSTNDLEDSESEEEE